MRLALQVGQPSRRVSLVFYRDCRHLQRSDPAIRAFLQRLDCLGGEPPPDRLFEILLNLFAGKAQIIGIQLNDATFSAQEIQVQLRLAAAGDHYVQVGWQVFEQKTNPLEYHWIFQNLEIVEHHDPLSREGGDFVDQQGHSHLQSIARGNLAKIQRFFPQPGFKGLQSANQIAEKAAEIVIVAVQG